MAAASLAIFPAVSSWADGDNDAAETTIRELSDGEQITFSSPTTNLFAGETLNVTTNEISVDDAGANSGAWLRHDTNNVSTSYTFGSADSKFTVTGSGFLGIAFAYGNSTTLVNVDLSNVDMSGYSGQFAVVNTWNNPVAVTIGGTNWGDVEYVFAGVTREWWTHGATSGSPDALSVPHVRGVEDNNSKTADTLKLSGDTTLAGITGTSQGFTFNGTSMNSHEFITANSAGTTLTLSGSGTYAYYGTVGSSSTAINIAKTGSGEQTLGGTNYLGAVTVSDGALALGGTNHISNVRVESGTLSLSGTSYLSEATVEGGNLDLSGTVALTQAISNSGTISLASDIVFDLSSTSSSDNTYTLITGSGSVVVGDSGSWNNLTASNFMLDGYALARVDGFNLDTVGQVTFTVRNLDLTWAGNSGAVWSTTNAVWTSGGESYAFATNDNITIGAAGESTSGNANIINVENGTTMKVGDMTVAGGKYELQINNGADGNSATIIGNTLTVEQGAVLQIGSVDRQFMTLHFDKVNLAGKIIYDDDYSAWNTLEFTTAGAELNIYDLNGDSNGHGLSITNTIVSADAKITTQWAGTGNPVSLGILSGSGNLDITGSNGSSETLLVQVADTTGYSGVISITGGSEAGATLKLNGSAYNSDSATIRIGSGGTLDINGTPDTGFKLVLDGGTLTDTGASVAGSKKQLPTITLTADSTVNSDSGKSYGVIGGGYGESDLYLGGHTLTKTGAGEFYLVDNEIYNSTDDHTGAAGNIVIRGGTLTFDGVDGSRTNVTVESGGTLSVNFDNNGPAANHKSSSVNTLTSTGTVAIANNCTLIIDGDSTLAGTLTIGGNSRLLVNAGATVDLTGVTASSNGGTGTCVISGEGSTLKVANYAWGTASNFGANFNNPYLQISDGGILDVTGGQANEGSGRRGFSVYGTGGTYRYSGVGTSWIADNDANQSIHLADSTKLIFEVVNSGATLDVTKLIANSENGAAAAVSTGALEKTGAGTLILSNENLYSGGTTVSEGTLVVQGGNALGSGNVSVAEGAILRLDVAVATAGTVSFAEGSTLVLGDDFFPSIAVAALDLSDTTAIASEYAIITAEEIYFGSEGLNDYTGDVSELVNGYISGDVLENYTLAWNYDNGTLSVAISQDVPEPSMFGLVAGIGAIGLVAARRNRRRNNRKA